MARADFAGILRVLAHHEVEYIVVGGVAAVLEGAPVSTFDLDIVHLRQPDNIQCLLRALADLRAVYRMAPERAPDESHLQSEGHRLLMTRLGPLDILGAVGRSRDYTDLLPECIRAEVDEGISARVLRLESVIAIKEELATEKDRAVLPVLRATLLRRKK